MYLGTVKNNYIAFFPFSVPYVPIYIIGVWVSNNILYTTSTVATCVPMYTINTSYTLCAGEWAGTPIKRVRDDLYRLPVDRVYQNNINRNVTCNIRVWADRNIASDQYWFSRTIMCTQTFLSLTSFNIILWATREPPKTNPYFIRYIDQRFSQPVVREKLIGGTLRKSPSIKWKAEHWSHKKVDKYGEHFQTG